MSSRDVPPRFAVAFSFAGEQRQLVLAVAQEVEAVLGRSSVFYDDWYEHWLAGRDSDLLLQDLYSERSDLIVVCVSGDYGRKAWTRTENTAIRASILEPEFEATRHRILPVRVGDGDVPGVHATDIVPDLRARSPAEAADLIIARLNLVKRPVEVAGLTEAQWPVETPALDWAVADHSGAREAFAMLLTGSSSSRALMIQGPSETGKTHISKQMTRNAMALGLRCGRFEFKGTTEMSVQIEAFSHQLGIEPPDRRSLIEQLGKILTDLRRESRSTVLIFDAYEAAGDTSAWIENVLMQHLVSATWLRVVVIGQTVPVRTGTTWESAAARSMTLVRPGLDDWFAYGCKHRGGEVDRNFVEQVHHHADGKASLMASLLGPRN